MNKFYDIVGDDSIQLSPWELKKRGLGETRAIFLLQKELKFRSDIAGGDIIVPAGFLSDLASIPKIGWSIMGPNDPRISLASWFHDLLYSTQGTAGGLHLTRKECDQVLIEGMAELGANKFQQNAVYSALRMGGNSSFNTDPPDVRWKFVNLRPRP